MRDGLRPLRVIQMLLVFVVICSLMCEHCLLDVSAQMLRGWSEPINLSSAIDQGIGETVAIASGRDGWVHVVWNSGPNPRLSPTTMGQPAVLYYTAWNGSEWSVPVDIIVVTNGSASSPRLAVDSRGIIHLVFPGDNGLSYTSSMVPHPASARDWRPPITLGGPTMLQDLFIDKQDTLHLVYASADNALHYLRSDTGGQTWSSPMLIVTGTSEEFLTMPATTVDALGGIHVVWSGNQLPSGYPPTGVYFASSFDGGATWTSPLILQDGLASEPTIVAKGEELHAVWGSAAAWAKRFYRHSPDRGKTWGPIVQLVDGGGGLLWQPTAVVDAVGTVYVVTNQDIGALYMFRQDENWTTPQNIFPAPMAHARLALGLGNQLHLVFRDQRDASVQYMRLELPIPGEEAIVFPTPMPTALSEPTLVAPMAVVSPKPTQTPVPNHLSSPPLPRSSTAFSMLLSTTATMLVIVTVMAMHLYRTRHGRH